MTVYGGQFTGGIDIRGNGQLLILGSNFNIQPARSISRLPTVAKACRPTPKSTSPASTATDRPCPLSFEMGATVLSDRCLPSSSAVLFYTPEPASASLRIQPRPTGRASPAAHCLTHGEPRGPSASRALDSRRLKLFSTFGTPFAVRLHRHVLAVTTRAPFRRLTAPAPQFAVPIRFTVCDFSPRDTRQCLVQRMR